MEHTAKLLGCFFVLGTIAGFSAFFGWITMLVFNAISSRYDGPQISFWIGWGIWFLLATLFSTARSSINSKK